MDVAVLLTDLYGRIPPLAREAVEGLRAEDLHTSPVPGANTIGWLVWHLTRVQDHHVSELMGADQVWTTDGWASRLGIEAGADDTGYGHTRDEMESVRPASGQALLDHLDAVHARTLELIAGLGEEELDSVVDRRWDPPVTMGVRLVSVADDGLQHVGQANYARGMLGR